MAKAEIQFGELGGTPTLYKHTKQFTGTPTSSHIAISIIGTIFGAISQTTSGSYKIKSVSYKDDEGVYYSTDANFLSLFTGGGYLYQTGNTAYIPTGTNNNGTYDIIYWTDSPEEPS